MKKIILGLALALSCVSLASCSEPTELTIVRLDQGFLGQYADELSVSIGLAKGQDDLKTSINQALSELSQEQRNQMMLDAMGRAEVERGENTGITTAPNDPNKPDLVVGMECNYAPFNWTQTFSSEHSWPIEGSQYYADGYDVAIAKYIAESIGYDLVIKKYAEFDALPVGITTGDINTIIAGMTDTEERRQVIDFTDIYYISELVLVVRKGSELENITTASQLAGYRLVSQKGTVTNSIIDEIEGVEHLTPVADFSTAALAVLTGDADAMTAEYPVAVSIVEAYSR